MKRVFEIFKFDLKHIFTNVASIIIALGLVVLPTVFTSLNVIACWDAFDRTDNLKVAVATEDAGYKSELLPLKVNLGDQVVAGLFRDASLDWVITDKDDAVEGVKSGKYYASLVLPQNFSKDMLTFYKDDGEKAEIIYYTNEKKNAVAPKLTEQSANSVSTKVNGVFTQILSEIALNIASSMVDYSSGINLMDKINNLGDKVVEAGNKFNLLSSELEPFVDICNSITKMINDSADMLKLTQESLNIDIMLADRTIYDINATVDKLEDAKRELNEKLDSISKQFDEKIAALEEKLKQYESMPAPYDEIVKILEAEIETIQGIKADLIIEKDQINNSIDEKIDQFKNSENNAIQKAQPVIQSLQNSLQSAVDSIKSKTTDVNKAKDKIYSIQNNLKESSKEVVEAGQKVKEASKSENIEMIENLIGKDVNDFAKMISEPVQIERNTIFSVPAFGESMYPLYATVGIFIGSLLLVVAIKPKPSPKLINKMNEGLPTLKDSIKTSFEGDIKGSVQQAALSLKRVKPRHEFWGHYLIFLLFSILQTTSLSFAAILIIGIQCADTPLFLLSQCIVGIVFSFIIYTLVVSFANLGKALTVILLVVQITGCNGSFPIELLPGFISVISPWLPATHSVSAMRCALMGIYNGDFWIEIGILLLYIIPFAIMGLLLRKPFVKFMDAYIEKVEKAKIIN